MARRGGRESRGRKRREGGGERKRGERNRWESEGKRREGGGREGRGESMHSVTIISLRLSGEERNMSVVLEKLVSWKLGRKKRSSWRRIRLALLTCWEVMAEQ